MQNKTMVGVVIPAYNEERNLARLVQQILDEQWTPDLDLAAIVVVDDCSDDRTSVIAQDLARSHGIVRVVRHSQRSGKNAAMRTGLSACPGVDVAIFVDADVGLAPDCLVRMVRFLDRSPHLAGVSCINEPLPARTWREKPSRFQALLIADLRRHGHGSLARVFALRLSAIGDLVLPDNIYDDLYIMRWLHNHGQRYAVCSDAIAYIRSATGLRDFAKQTIRAWRAEAALDTVIPLQVKEPERPIHKRILVQSVIRAASQEPLGFLLYLVWRLIISLTPHPWWVPIVDHSRYDTSLSTKDVEPSLDG